MKDNKIQINLTRFPFCFRCVTTGEFTNKLKDSNSFFEKLKLTFERDIPHLIQYTFDNIYTNTNKHSHNISQSSDKYNLVIKIIQDLYKSWKPNSSEADIELFLENNINDYGLWQLGYTGGIRIIGIRQDYMFHVLFFDYHHLIYPDLNYNQENCLNYNFCPITKCERED